MAHEFNDVVVRTPTSFGWDLVDETAGDTEAADGTDYSEIITQKRSLSYQWSDPTKEEVSAILKLINQSRYVKIKYPDSMSGEYETREFKNTKKSAPFRDLRVGAFVHSSLSLQFEERKGDAL
jgi:hypothetical protein